MVRSRTKAAPVRRRSQPRSCRCPDSSNRWAGFELVDRVREGVRNVKEGVGEARQIAHEVRQAVLPDQTHKDWKEKKQKWKEENRNDRERWAHDRQVFAQRNHVRQDPSNKNRFWIDHRAYVEVWFDDDRPITSQNAGTDPTNEMVTSVEVAQMAIRNYRNYVLTGGKIPAGQPGPKYKHAEELEKIEQEADLLAQKARVKRLKDELAGKDNLRGRSYASPGRAKDDIIKPPYFAGAVADGKTTKGVYNYKKVSETAGALLGDFNYRLAPPAVRRPPCTCRRRS